MRRIDTASEDDAHRWQRFIFLQRDQRPWRDIFGADELRLYDAAADRELTPECRRWLEQGGMV